MQANIIPLAPAADRETRRLILTTPSLCAEKALSRRCGVARSAECSAATIGDEGLMGGFYFLDSSKAECLVPLGYVRDSRPLFRYIHETALVERRRVNLCTIL